MICPSCGHNNIPGSEACANCLLDLTQLDLPQPNNRVERSLMTGTVAQLSPRPAVSVAPDATVATAMSVMLRENIGSVLVEEGGRLVGVFSERDLLTRAAGRVDGWQGRPVRDFMTPSPESVRSSDSLAFALHKMDVGGYRHLPVLHDGQLQGVVSVRDLLRHITQLCHCA